MKTKLAIYLGAFWLVACSTAPDKLGKLDVKKWRSDRGGCYGLRMSETEHFKAEMQAIKGMHINDVGELLGRPDINQIEDRNQKYYVYYLEKGPQCDQERTKSKSLSVALRVSAIGLVTEITFQNGIP